MLAPWPQVQEQWQFTEDAAQMNVLMEAIKAVRNLRAEAKVPMGKRAPIMLKGGTAALTRLLQTYESYFHTLAFADTVTLLKETDGKPENAVVAVVPGVEIYLPLKDLIDVEKELARVQKEKAKIIKEIARLEGKLQNAGFLSKAPAEVIAKEKEKLATYQEKMTSLTQRLQELKNL